jgi:hypothetical protein
MILNIKVTQEDIDRGKRDSSFACPVARAASRWGFVALVGGIFINLYAYGGRGFRCQLPQDTVNFIKSFDTGEPVKPFEFELNVTEGIMI